MIDSPISTEQWLRQELDFINTTMSHTLNGQLKAAFVSCDDHTQELTLGFGGVPKIFSARIALVKP